MVTIAISVAPLDRVEGTSRVAHRTRFYQSTWSYSALKTWQNSAHLNCLAGVDVDPIIAITP